MKPRQIVFMKKGLPVVLTIVLVFSTIGIVSAEPYKSTFTCIEDPLFQTCLTASRVGCSQIFQDSGGATSSWCTIAGGAGNGTYDLNFTGDTGAGTIYDNEVLDIAGGNDISTFASGNTLTTSLESVINTVRAVYTPSNEDVNFTLDSGSEGANKFAFYDRNDAIMFMITDSNLTFNKNLIPWTDEDFNIGDPSFKISELYVSDIYPASLVNYYSSACPTGQFITDISNGGTFSCSVPAGKGNTTEQTVDAVLGQANHTIIYNDTGDNWGFNVSWGDERYIGTDLDTNASTACNGGEVLLGNGTCHNVSFTDTTGGHFTTDQDGGLNKTSNVTFAKGNFTGGLFVSSYRNDSLIYTDLANDRIGINTKTPTHKVEIVDDSKGWGFGVLTYVLRLVGPGIFGEGSLLGFGDANFVYMGEYYDDKFTMYGEKGVFIEGGHGYAPGLGCLAVGYNASIYGCGDDLGNSAFDINGTMRLDNGSLNLLNGNLDVNGDANISGDLFYPQPCTQPARSFNTEYTNGNRTIEIFVSANLSWADDATGVAAIAYMSGYKGPSVANTLVAQAGVWRAYSLVVPVLAMAEFRQISFMVPPGNKYSVNLTKTGIAAGELVVWEECKV